MGLNRLPTKTFNHKRKPKNEHPTSRPIEGKNFDYCRLIVATPLDSSQGNALGSSTTEYDFGGSANFEQFRNAQFPIEANLNVEIVTTGKTQKLKVIGFQPVKKG